MIIYIIVYDNIIYRISKYNIYHIFRIKDDFQKSNICLPVKTDFRVIIYSRNNTFSRKFITFTNIF